VLEQATRPTVETLRPDVSGAARREAFVPTRPLRGHAFRAHTSPASALESLAKRTLDLTLAIPALLVLGPLMVAVAIAIRLDSPGPVFIAQERVSKGLRTFRMFKFRSMVANADELVASLQALNEATPPLFKIRNDPRITRLGRYLRKLSIDELPQLFNVLRGEMSLVGPRPPLVHEVLHDRWRQSIRLRHSPGMTGLWQVSGRSDLTYDTMIALDLKYVRDWSIWLDMAILLRTPTVVLKGKGAR
jgi:lipopolysaccharide/colanic/teichoic acid biosynthesis glycosyltransferase